jgi:hypothetical protein
MTAVAKFALIRDGKKLVLHHNVGAYDALYLSLAGPDLTIRYLDAYHRAYGPAAESDLDPGGWCHNAEGGVLVDCNQRVLLVFTVYASLTERAAYAAATARAWPEWRVEWAYDGIAELMHHAGDGELIDLGDRVVDPDDLDLGHHRYGVRQQKVACVNLVTVTDAEGRTAAHSVTDPHPWWVGEALVAALGEESLVDSCPTMPEAGLHLDLRTHEAWLWTCCSRLFGIRERWSDLWPEWDLHFCGDRYAEQLDRCADVVDPPRPKATEGFDSLRKGFEIHWRTYVPDHPDRGPAFFDEEMRTHLTVTRAEFDAVLALIRPDDPTDEAV